ncbi:L-fuculokinase [Rodentibacter haemolyticus]|uniref:L-fuculokinase n=1 Tax=Rodentibacter haemolyticus TaxID=2778911 RepID=A0ABX6UVK5_9PAST|nr:L-fuculokinase [Rodentibacter haemolyticus]QPB41994.1 L-fuculokinase [Rodentibacter haemolyticus]
MSVVLIFDCGATNLRTIAIDQYGKIVAAHHLPNKTKQGLESPDYHIWDFEEIWQKLLHCTQQTLSRLKEMTIPLSEVIGIGVTTFGVDGTMFDKQGKQLYPVISWKCPRTQMIMQRLEHYLDVQKLYQRNGVGQYAFNTLFKLLWLKENQPTLYARMDKFLFISSMITYRLTGNLTTDRTMAGTSMMTNLSSGDWDQEVLQVLGLTPDRFPPMLNAGEQVGVLNATLTEQLGLSPIPVISCGHDTQFAVFGSGAALHQPVLSSGTWEILMARTHIAEPDIAFIPQGLTTEFDAQSNCFNPAVQWVGSGVMEWVGRMFFSDVMNSERYYETMIREAEQQAVGSGGIFAGGCFSELHKGTLYGLSMHCQRGQIYRAMLEYMALRLKQGLTVLQQVSHFQAESVICVGGGSKNRLWNQIRADVLNLPIEIVDVSESTVLGAAMFVFTALRVYPNVETAQRQMRAKTQRIYPSAQSVAYQQWLQQYQERLC